MELNKKTTHTYSEGKAFLNRNVLNQIYNDVNQQNRNINLLKNAILNEYSNRHMSVANLDYKNSNNPLSHPCDTENATNSFNYNLSCNINFELANTYSIDILNSFHSNNQNTNKTYSLRMSTNLSYNNNATKTLPSFTTTNRSVVSRNDNYYEKYKSVYISESHSNDESIEPLIYCEAILDSNELRDVEQEFELSFLQNEKRDVDTVLNVNYCNNVTYESQQKSQYFCDEKVETNTISKEFSANEKPIYNIIQKDDPNNERIKDLPLENNYFSIQIPNNETNNEDYFQIQSRQSFVPKGMCEICKYTLIMKQQRLKKVCLQVCPKFLRINCTKIQETTI